MKNDYTLRSIVTLLATTLLLGLAAWTSPTPAAAETITYIYTGKPFTYEMPGSVWPSTPAIGDHISCSFTYDGDLSAALNINLVGKPALVDFQITCGDVGLGIPIVPGLRDLLIIKGMTSGVPSSWIFHLGAFGSGVEGYGFESDWFTDARSDYGYYLEADGAVRAYRQSDGLTAVGTWTAVPVPSSAFLLGPGLLSLAGWRRLRKS
jgi:hypothetical protein